MSQVLRSGSPKARLRVVACRAHLFYVQEWGGIPLDERSFDNGRYRVVREIGRGAMGIVYLARDTRLPRDVAIKVLHPGTLTDEPAREAFRNEAEVLAMMGHSNIATIFDFDDTGTDGDYLVMEYVPGETLSDVLAHGPLPESRVVEWGAQLLDGLASAHLKRLVHRDLKPGNLRITPDGVLKILDFGVARLWGQEVEMSKADESPVVRRGKTLFMTRSFAGTFPYVSPEQLKGGQVDARADLYAAGAVLYEMATGAEIFRAVPDTELADAIEGRSPIRPRKLQRKISRPLQAVVQRALAKQPEQRFASARAMRSALLRTRWLRFRFTTAAIAALLLLGLGFALDAGGSRSRTFPNFAAGEVRTLFLLQFENATGNGAHDDLCTGLTRDIIDALNRTRTVRTLAPATAFHFKARGRVADEFAHQHGAQAVVRGILRQHDEKLRLTAEIRKPGAWRAVDEVAWDVEPSALARLEADVVAGVRSRLHLPVSAAEASPFVESPALPLYHRGLAWLGRPQADAWEQASDLFEAAILADSTFAPAHAARALASFATPSDVLPIQEALSRTWDEGVRALAFDPGLPVAYLALAIVHGLRDENWDEAMQNLSRALELDPAQAAAHRFLGYAFIYAQRFKDATMELQRAWELDPLNSVTRDTLWSHFASGRFDSVVTHARRTLERHPDDWEAHLILGQALGALDADGAALHNETAHQILRFLVPRDLFDERRSFDPGAPVAGCASPGRVYVSDLSAFGGRGGVIALDPETGRQTAIASGGWLSAGIGMTVARDGDLLVSCHGTSSIVRIDLRTGRQSLVTAGQLLLNPACIWVESSDAVLVADWNLWNPSRVIRIDLASGIQTAIRVDSLVVNAIGILETAPGDLLVSDCTASANGGAIVHVTASGACRVLARNGFLMGPMGMARGPDGFVYAADFNAFGGEGGVIRVDPATGAQSIVSRGGAFEDPFDLVFLPDGDLLVADFSEFGVDGCLVRVDPRTGEQKRVYKGGMFVRPAGIAILPGGTVSRSQDLVVAGPMRIRGGHFDSVTLQQSAVLAVDGQLAVRGDLLVSSGARLVSSGPIRVAGDAFIEKGAKVSHAPGHLAGLELDIGGTLAIQAGGRIDVTGCGLRGGTIDTQWRGESFDEAGRVILGSPGRATKGSGGSYGGLGARDDDGGMSGPTYGRADDPRFLGAGGGGPGGGKGGGRVTARARRIVVDGLVCANGAPGVEFLHEAGGGGAGGSVRLQAREIVGSGRIEASGGNAGCTISCSGAGGGGRVLISCTMSALPSENVSAAPGIGRIRSTAGTVRWRVGKSEPPLMTVGRLVQRTSQP